MTERTQQPTPRYEIRIGGHLGATLLSAFPDLEADSRGGDTYLRGGIRDQAQLHGLLSRIEALGLDLVEIRRLAQ